MEDMNDVALLTAPQTRPDQLAPYLHWPKVDELRRTNSIQTEAELARFIGVSTPDLSSAIQGGPVSVVFMARLKVAFPHTSLDQLFTLQAA
jgi:hypothetical protein